MKKTIVLLFCLSIIVCISGCKTQEKLYQSDLSFSSDFVNLNCDDNSSQLQSTDDETETVDNSNTTPSEETTANNTNNTIQHSTEVSNNAIICEHTYRESVRNALCTAEGYVEYVCAKCNDSYKQAIPAEHTYLKYLCERCGKVDPQSDKFWAINAWLNTYGQPNGKGNMNCFPSDVSELSISNYLDQNSFFIDYNDATTGTTFSVYVCGVDVCSVNFRKGSTSGSYEIKNSALSSANKIVFDEFYTSEDNPIDQDVFATECASMIDECMLKAQNQILYPKMGLKLKDFGFICYQ